MTKDFANYKNNKTFRKQAGQILIMFLLVLVVGLALVLSVASRSITDIRITTSTDESNRAYFAAEAGVEEALKQLQKDSDYPGGELDFTAVNQTKAKVSVKTLTSPGASAAFYFPEKYDRDSVAQINLMTEFNTLAAGAALGVGNVLKIYYGDIDSVGTEPAIEVSVVHTNGTEWGIKKFAYDVTGVHVSNNFCRSDDDQIIVDTQDGEKGFAHSVTVPFMEGYDPACAGGSVVLEGVKSESGHYPVLARIRFLYNDQPQPIAVGTNGTFVLPDQGMEVISTGSTVSGITRKLKVTKLFPALPSIFDYVLFSGGDLVK